MNIDRINELYAGQIFSPETQKAARERIHWICSRVRGDKILDIGCSQGIVCLLLGREGFNCIGVDYEKAAIDYALKELEKEEETTQKKVAFQLADATRLPFEDASFDTVILGELLEHLIHPEKVLNEAKRVLKNGGRAIITVPFGLNPAPDHKRTYYPIPFLEDIQPFFETISVDTIENYIIYCGEKDSSSGSSKKSRETFLNEYLRLQRSVEERCLLKEQTLYEKSNQFIEQARKLNEQVASLSKMNKDLRETLEKRDREYKETVAELEAKEKEFMDALVRKDEDWQRKFTDKNREIREAIAEKEKEINELLAGKVTELETKDKEFMDALVRKDEDWQRKFTDKNREIKEKLEAAKIEKEASLSFQGELFKNAWKWRIGSIFVEGYILVRDFVKHPIQFIKGAGTRFKEYFYAINPGALPQIKEEEKLRRNVLNKTSLAVPSTDNNDLSFETKKEVVTPNEDKISIGCILDEFTNACFQPECKLITFRPDNWKEILESHMPNGIFVESAWHGNGGSWQYRIAKYSKNMGDELLHLLAWAKEKKVPSFFWNKEDPTHIERFVDKAKLFDYVFTTDADCIPRYKKEVGHDRIFALPFAAQPQIHNPVLEHPRENAICFAGTYYAMFPERCQNMETILKPALDFGLHIYDRQYGLTGPEAAQYRFPDIYQSAIKGRLDYKDMLSAYKNYRVFLNVNSVKNSPTMFSRRVFELLACGTPVISTYSKGIEKLLGSDLVLIAESEAETRGYLDKLLHDEDYWSALSVKGIRKVMEEHTYSERMKFISDCAGLNYSVLPLPSFTVISIAENERDVENLRDSVSRQKYRKFDVMLLTKEDLSSALQRTRNALPDIEIKTLPLAADTSYSDGLKACRGDFIAVFDCKDYYGANYLRDYAITVRYARTSYIGKNAYYCFRKGEMKASGDEFRFVHEVPTATLAIKRDVIDPGYFRTLLGNTHFQTGKNKILSLDRFNYVKAASGDSLPEDKKKTMEV